MYVCMYVCMHIWWEEGCEHSTPLTWSPTNAWIIYIHMRIAVEGCEHNQPIAMPGKVMLHVLVSEEELVVAEGRPRELAGRGDGA